MSTRQNSPNWHWQCLGYAVERNARGARTIRRPDDSAVEVSRHGGEDTYSAELRAAEREYRHLPHGPAECRAAQKELPL